MIKALIDTNIVLDIALKRQPFFECSSKVFDAIDDQLLEGYISATSITDIYYIASKQNGKPQARAFILSLVKVLEIVGVEKRIIMDALNSDFSDFEDAIQAFSANAYSLDIIITRNIKDFKNSPVKVIKPKEFIEQIKKQP